MDDWKDGIMEGWNIGRVEEGWKVGRGEEGGRLEEGKRVEG